MKLKYLFIVILCSSRVCLLTVSAQIDAANFTRGTETAVNFGVHEIVLIGDGSVPNPFDTHCELTFTSPSGIATKVNAFYDGENTWRARCYINEIGEWYWGSFSSGDTGLDNKTGFFSAVTSDLRGKLKKHPDNPKALATDDGNWFLNIGDTPYLIFHDKYSKWQEFLRDSWNRGITLIRASMIGALREWDRFFEGDNQDQLNTNHFQTNDTRIIWMLDNYPDMYVEFILFSESNTGWSGDETMWHNMNAVKRLRILKYLVARYAAFPQIIWEVVNDYGYSSLHPNNVEMTNEVGNYLMNNDPWNHLITSGGIRGDAFYFVNTDWATLIHLETIDALSADQVNDYADDPVHVFNAEDRYETYKEPDFPGIYFRRLLWSWTLSGGSACYGGDWDSIIPYNQSSFEGLDHIIHLKNFFLDNRLDLSGYIPDDNCARSSATGDGRPKIMRTAQKSSYIIYHPNADNGGQGANISSATASLSINGLREGRYELLMMRADNGVNQKTYFTHDGGASLLVSPWSGIDVVFYLQIRSDVGVESLSLPVDSEVLSVQPNLSEASTSIRINFPENEKLCLDVYDVQGKCIERLAYGKFERGVHQFIWNTDHHPDGIYFIKLQTERKVYGQMISLSSG